MSDFGLIQEISAGNITALEELYKKYKSDVYKLAYMMIKHPQTAEDIMQDVFLSVVKGAKSYKRDISVKGWILTITRNTTLNIIKHNSVVCPAGDEIADIVSKDNCFLAIELSILLKGLNQVEQEIVLLHINYGLKHKEIAKILSINYDTERKQYQRAKEKLKKQLCN